MNVQKLSKIAAPPIVEAVVDFDCDMPIELDLRKQQVFILKEVSPEYPRVEPIHRVDFSFQFDTSDITSEIEQSLEALRFHSEDGKQIIQYRRTGFSFNRLAPYSSFDDYSDEIQKRWMQFLQLAKPVVLRTLRLRYINTLNIPIKDGQVDLAQYLNSAVVLRENGLESGEFLLRLNVTDGRRLLNGVIVSVLQARTKTHAPVVVDIAVQKDLVCELDDMATIQEALDSLRSFKNNIFASVITKELLRTLEEAT